MKVLPRWMGAYLTARSRSDDRAIYLGHLRETLRKLVAEGSSLEPFDHGDVLGQLRWELNTLSIEMGDHLRAARRSRRVNSNISPGVRQRVYQRDRYTCQRCGWESPEVYSQRSEAARHGRFLTIDHLISLAEGGRNHQENLVTVCSPCNQAKGHKLPPLEVVG